MIYTKPKILFQVLKGKPTIDGRPGESMDDLDFDKLENELKNEHGNKKVELP